MAPTWAVAGLLFFDLNPIQFIDLNQVDFNQPTRSVDSANLRRDSKNTLTEHLNIVQRITK